MNHPAIRSNAILFKRLQTFDFLGDVDDTILTAIALGESGVWSIPRHAPEEIVLTHLQTAMQIIESMAEAEGM